MRIAYLALYQGATLAQRRPIGRNLSLAARTKIERIAELLRRSSHTVEILSQGEVIERQCKFYPAFSEPDPFYAKIPVFYSSAFPIRFLNGLWSSTSLLRLFKSRHQFSPYDLVFIYNLKPPQVACARHAIRCLGLPVILEYEDGAFFDDRSEKSAGGFTSRHYLCAAQKLLNSVSGCMAVSPYLLSQLPSHLPKLLLRGIVSDDTVTTSAEMRGRKKNWILFSGTHGKSNGIANLIAAWDPATLAGWELHITGDGDLTASLRQLAASKQGIVFHGMVNRQELVRLMCSARICINPHEVSRTPGNVFAFKIIEYLASGAHVVTTPMGVLEKEIEKGITYMPDNNPDTITATLKQVIRDRRYEQGAEQEVQQTYGPAAVSKSLNLLIENVMRNSLQKS